MQDYYTPPPGQLILDVFTLGAVLLVAFFIWTIAKDLWNQHERRQMRKRHEEYKRQNPGAFPPKK